VAEYREIPLPCVFEMDKLVIMLDEVLASDVTVIDDAVAKMMALIEQTGCWDDSENIELALREALANAIIHGNHSNPAKAVRVCVALQPGCNLLIIVKDAGAGFDLSQLPDPVLGQQLFSDHGRGVFLINRLMEDVRFSFDHGTAIHMRRTVAKRTD
jgi:serine/threonine-protein kinase RsbW